MLPNASTQYKPLVCPKFNKTQSAGSPQESTQQTPLVRLNTTQTSGSMQCKLLVAPSFNAALTFGSLQTATQHKPLVCPNVQHNTVLWFSLKLNTTLWSALSLNATLWSASNFNPAQTFGSFQALKQHKPLVCSIFSTHYNHLVRTILQQKHKHLHLR